MNLEETYLSFFFLMKYRICKIKIISFIDM